MPHGFGGPATGEETGAKTVIVAPGGVVRVPDGVALLNARLQRAGNDLVIIPVDDGAPVLIASFFARAIVPDLEEASGMRLSGRLVAELAGRGAAAGEWAAKIAGVDAEAALAAGDAADAGEEASPSAVGAGAGEAVSPAAESALDADGVEVSAGGDENAMPGDTIAVTQAIDAFNLHPQSMAYGPSRFETIVLPPVDFSPPPDEDTALLLLRTQEQVSLPPPLEVTRWDNGRRWEAIGSFIEISGSEPEALIEAGRLITARDGFMARLEADVAISTEQIAKFLEVDPAILRAAIPASTPTSGTAMRIANSLSLAKGETIHFDVFFDGASHLPFNDAAIMTVRTQGRTLTVPISSIAELDAAGRGGSGWLTVSYTTGVAGSYAFGFAVLNDDDRSPSRLYVDHVRRGSAAGQLEATHSIADSLGGATTVHRPLPGFHEPVQQFVLSPEGTLAINALANVIDPDGYDAPRLDGVDRSGTLGAVDFDGLGNIVYDPRNFYRALAAGERGTDRFLYRIDGGNGGIAGARVEVTLSEAGVNDAPTAANDSATVDLERLARSGLPQTIAVLLNDDDVDSDDDRSTLSIVAATSEAGADVAIVGGAALAAFGLTYDAGAVAAARSLSLGETLAAADWVTYRIADRWGATAEARVAITWIGANDAPTANTDSARAGEDGAAAVVDVLANDDDVDGDDDASTLRLVAAEAERGTAQVTADHRLSISASGFAGLALGEEATYAVRYTVADRHGATADGRVDVIVAGANDAPIAIADRARAIEDGEPVAINVLANDDDIDSDDDASTLTVLSARSARGAAVVVGADGVLHYRLAGIAAFDALREGEQADAFDIITYVVSDRHGATAEGRVEVTVTGRNDPIAAGDDQFADDGFGRPRAVSEDRIDPLPVLDNDIDPDRGDTRTITHINGVAVAADGSWRALPSGAAVALLATGEIAVDPRGRFDWLAVGESATETFTYTVADGHGSNDTATVTLIVRGLNDAPVARDDIAETDAETPLRVFALANDDDPDRGDRLTLTGTDTVSDLFAVGAGASVVFDPRGRLQHLSLGQTEQLWLRYEIADAHGATGQARVIVTVHGVNDAPIAGEDAVLVFADRGIAPSLGTSLLDNDGDPDQWDRLRITAINGDGAAVGRPLALPAGGLLTVLADGTFAYDPLGAFDPLASGELATVVFSYSVGDGHGAQDTAQVTLVVRGVNDPPVPRADAAAVVENGAGVVVDVLANDVDPDGAAETAALRLVSAVSASGADARITGDGKIAYATLGAFDGLALGQIATDDVVYTVRDRFGAEAQGRLTVTISGRNDAPTAAADVATVAADGVAVIDVRANDDDIDADDDAASLRLVAATTAWGETVAITADGQLAIDARDIAALRQLGAGAIRTFEGAIVYTIADRHGALATGTVDLVVSGVNDPIIAVDDAFSVSEDGAAQLAVGANDVDPDLGDGRQITAINGAAAGVGDRIHLPSGAILTVLAGGSVSYDPAGSFGVLGEGEAAFDRFTYAIADDAGSGDEAAVTVTVTGRNASPVAHADTAVTQQDAEVRIAVLANDSDADVRDTLSITGIDQAQTLGRVRINADGTVTYDPAGAFAGLGAGATATDTFSYILSDGRGGAARATVTVTIHGTGHGTGETTAGSQQLLFPFEVSDGDAASARFPGWRQEPAPGSGTTAVAQIGVFDGRLAAFSTTHLDKAAVLAANGGPVTGIVDLLNLPTGSLGGTRGAALATLVSVGPADVGHDGRITLSFDWNFIGGETGNPAALDDRAVFAISDGTGVSEASRWFVFTLAELAGSDGAATGWRTSVFDLSEAFTIPPAGLSLTIGFAITGSADLVNPSRLLLDDVRFNGAPSPDATLIGGSGDDRLATWRPNPTAIDDGVVGTVGEDGALVIEAGGLVANDLASAGATAASRRMVAAGTESGRGVVSVSGGSIHYLAAGGHDDLAAGAQRVETLIYTLTDANGGTDTARARIVVTGVNDAPVAAAAALTASEDAAVAIEMPALLALARDPDSGDQLSLSGIDAAGVRGLVSADAFTIRYDPGSAFQWLAAGQTATETIQYAVQDRLGAQGSAAITITISGRNDAPTALNDAFTVSEGATSDLSVLANDSDIDGDAVRISEINGAAVPADGIYHLPSGARLIVDPARGVLFDAAGRYDWLAAGESLAERFTYTVTDSHGERGEASVTVTIAGANDPPQARSDHAVTDEDAMVRIAVLANDSDADAADRLSVLSVDTAGTIGRVRIGPDGSLVYDPDGRFDGLFAGQSVMDTFRYTAADGHGGLSTATVQVTIHGSGTPQSHPQQLLSSFEIPWQQAGPGWEAEPFASGAASPIRLTAAFAGDFGAGRAIRDDLRPVLAGYGPTHLDHAVQLAAFGSSGRGPGILTSAIERFLELPGGALPDDTGAFAGEQGDGSEANTGAAIRSRIGLTGADAGPGGTLSLSFDWNFISAETVADNAPGSNDFALFSISDGTTVRAFTLADARSTGFGASGWRTSSFEVSGVFALPAAGALDLVIGFAVLNDQTPDNPSYLIVDNVRFNREIGGDYALVGASGDGVLQTWRQNPTAFDDAVAGAGTDEGMPITIALAELTANDAASRGAASVRVAAVERVIDGVSGEPIGGHVELRDTDGDGLADAVVYDPRGAFDHLKDGEAATDHFLYRITDGNGGSDQARVAVRVTGVNDAPAAAADVITGREDEPLAGNVLADNGSGRDRDVDGDPLRVDTVPVAAPQHGSLTLNADGTFVYRPDPNFHGVDTFTYRIFDRPDGGLSDSATVRLVIAPVNDVPIAGDDEGHTDEDSVLILAPLANDSDVDAHDILRPVAIAGNAADAGQPVTLASGAVATLNADGTIGYDPRGGFARLRAGEQAADTFSYTVGDGQGGTAEARITVTVDGRNDAPVAGLDRFATQANAAVAIAASQLLANDIDVDLGDVLTVTAVDGGAAKGSVTFDGHSLVYDPAGRLQALGAGERAVEVIRYTVSDEAGATAEGTIEVTVAGVNDPPQAVDDVAVTSERRAVVIDVLGNDRDPDSSDRFSMVDFDTSGTRGTVSLNPDGTVTYRANGAFDHLGAGQTATDRFRYVIADSSDARDTGEVTVTVTGQGSVERLVNSFEAPIRVEDISRGSSDAVAIKSQHVETDGGRGVYQPTDGNHLAWLEAYGTTRSTLDAFLGIDLRARFTDIDGSSPASGAAFRLEVALDAGDELSFDWLFDARDTVSGSPADNDFALVTVGDANGVNVFKLTDVRGTGDRGASGWLTTIFTASQSGTVTIGFAAVNDRGSDTPSAGNPASENSMLLVDNLRLNRDFSQGYQVVEASGDGRFETIAAPHA